MLLLRMQLTPKRYLSTNITDLGKEHAFGFNIYNYKILVGSMFLFG